MMKFFSNFFRNFSEPEESQDEAKRSELFWQALVEQAEVDIRLASELQDCGLLVSAMERHDLAERRLKEVSQND